MTQQHQWCTDFGKIIEGVCMQCETLNRQYPALGHLDFADEFLVYFPGSDPVPCNSSKNGVKRSRTVEPSDIR